MSRKKRVVVIVIAFLLQVMLLAAVVGTAQASTQSVAKSAVVTTRALDRRAATVHRQVRKLTRQVKAQAGKRLHRKNTVVAHWRVVRLNRALIALNRTVATADLPSDVIADVLSLNAKVRRLDTRSLTLVRKARLIKRQRTAAAKRLRAVRARVVMQTKVLRGKKPKPTPTVTPTPTPTPSDTPTPTPTPSDTPTPTPTPTPSDTPTPSPSMPAILVTDYGAEGDGVRVGGVSVGLGPG